MNKIQQIFGLDPEYNKKMEEEARKIKEKAPVGPYAFPNCEYGGAATETCDRYRVKGTAIRNSAWADRIRERFMRVV
mgnify:CR=1 FL=1